MTDMFENTNDCCVNLKIDLCGAELAKIAVDGNYTAETMEALSYLFTYLSTKKDAAIKVYFIKATELRDKFNRARKSGSTTSCVNTLVRYQCLIIDEIGHCKFDKENTQDTGLSF